MKIEKDFEIAQPPKRVWAAFSDLALVTSCVPGASITEDLGDGRYRARFAVKVGPLAAAFDGEMTLTRDDERRVGSVEGRGADARSNSRASGSMTWRLSSVERGTRVDLDCTMNLAGALAQFGKAAVMREVVNRITAEFARNLEARLEEGKEEGEKGSEEEAPSPLPPSPFPSAKPLDAGRLFGAIVRDWLRRLWRSLAGGAGRQ